jgi:hypothetical protein
VWSNGYVRDYGNAYGAFKEPMETFKQLITCQKSDKPFVLPGAEVKTDAKK